MKDEHQLHEDIRMVNEGLTSIAQTLQEKVMVIISSSKNIVFHYSF